MADPEKGEGPGFTPHALGDLDDVLRTAPTDGDTLVWDAAAGQWKPGAGGGGGLPAWFMSGSGPPFGTVTPSQKGAVYQDTTNGALYEALDTTSSDWISLGGHAVDLLGPTPDTVGLTVNPGPTVPANRAVYLVGGANAYAEITDQHGQSQTGTGNGLAFHGGGTDGNQSMALELGPAGEWIWEWKKDGAFALPNGNSLYNTATAPSNTVGADGDWSLGADGHIYYRTAGAWVQKV